MLARMLYLAAGLLLLALAVLAVVTLFISLGDLIRQLLFSADGFTRPVLCGAPIIDSLPCLPSLAAWHLLSFGFLLIIWRYGSTVLNRVDAILAHLP